MNQKHKLIILSFVIHLFIDNLQASSYGPNLIFHKPYNAQPYLADYHMAFAAGQTDKAYNEHGSTVPFLQQYGTEDLLKRFLDPTLPKQNTETVGSIAFSGVFNFQRLNLFYNKNIHHHMFFGIATTIQNLSVNNITTDITLTETLTDQEKQKLALFESKIPKQINSSGIYATSINFGYNKLYTHFKSLEFLQFFIQGSLGIPQWLYGHNLTILQYPLGGNIAFSYPITTTVKLGVSKNLNIGAFGLLIPMQPTELSAPINHTQSNNQLLLTEIARIQIRPKPVFSTSFYIETHNFLPHWMATIAYSYTYGMEWKIKSFNEALYPVDTINHNKLLNGFSISSLLFEINYNFAHDENSNAPTIGFFYSLPLAGNFYPQIQIIGGSYNMQINYVF